jgi:hypothetical protein
VSTIFVGLGEDPYILQERSPALFGVSSRSKSRGLSADSGRKGNSTSVPSSDSASGGRLVTVAGELGCTRDARNIFIIDHISLSVGLESNSAPLAIMYVAPWRPAWCKVATAS